MKRTTRAARLKSGEKGLRESSWMNTNALPSRDFSTCDVNLVVHASVGRVRRRRRVSAAPDPHGGAALAAALYGADSLTSAARPAWRA